MVSPTPCPGIPRSHVVWAGGICLALGATFLQFPGNHTARASVLVPVGHLCFRTASGICRAVPGLTVAAPEPGSGLPRDATTTQATWVGSLTVGRRAPLLAPPSPVLQAQSAACTG